MQVNTLKITLQPIESLTPMHVHLQHNIGVSLSTQEFSLLGVFVNMMGISHVCKHDCLSMIFPKMNNTATSNDQQ